LGEDRGAYSREAWNKIAWKRDGGGGRTCIRGEVLISNSSG